LARIEPVQRQLRFTKEACVQLSALEADIQRKGLHRQVLKTLGLLEANTRHPGLHTHEYESLTGANGERVWEAYAQNATPERTVPFSIATLMRERTRGARRS
jgi:hypothetical protein